MGDPSQNDSSPIEEINAGSGSPTIKQRQKENKNNNMMQCVLSWQQMKMRLSLSFQAGPKPTSEALSPKWPDTFHVMNFVPSNNCEHTLPQHKISKRESVGRRRWKFPTFSRPVRASDDGLCDGPPLHNTCAVKPHCKQNA